MTTATACAAVAEIAARARASCRDVLLEPEALEIVRLLGIEVPENVYVADASDDAWAIARACELPGDKVVVKVVAAEILHKSDVGGVAFVDKTPHAIAAMLERMRAMFAGHGPGFLICEMVTYDPAPGGEMLVGMRSTPDFGPVVTFGLGGVATEYFAEALKEGREIAILSPRLTPPGRIEQILLGKAITPLVTGGVRRMKVRYPMAELRALLERCMEFASKWVPDPLGELEINPVVIGPRGPVALDALVRLTTRSQEAPAERPIRKIGHLLRPSSIAVVGVSTALNAGHVIVNNLIREGFDKSKIFIVKPGSDEIEGCSCVASIAALPEPVDLLVLAVSAHQAPELIAEAIDTQRAESVIVIPGGLGELAGSEKLERQIRDVIGLSRQTRWGGPVINGGNCLGVRSAPGRVDTMFLPDYKVPHGGRPVSPVAFVSQSGAFAVAKANCLDTIEPRYVVSIGNQIDLTVGDYMRWLESDPEVRIAAFYVEGFRPLDGRDWLESAARMTRDGRSVILYRAGRTVEGAKASASHTASIAADAVVTRELATAAGVIVAETLEDFEDLVRLFTMLHGRAPAGPRIGAISNAGFESVAFADNVGGMHFAKLGAETIEAIGRVIRESKLERIVSIHNPLDVNPMMGDREFCAVFEAILADNEVDLGVVGCVPLTGALQTLPRSDRYKEDLADEGSVVSMLGSLWGVTSKPWIAIVDAGRMYDPMARALEGEGIPTFRSADRATRLAGVWCDWKLRFERWGTLRRE
ncbi:MAG: acetate--CoA ligase family protein [Acidobacteria bacterium]|nr:acetate--CoA ligase family protein [Acidobacteriota bacterium]